MFEVRYLDRLLGHTFVSQDAADTYVRTRLTHPIEGKALVQDGFTVEPLRAFSLVGRNGVIDTFHTQADAEAERNKLASAKPRNTQGGKRLIIGTNTFKIVSNIPKE